MSVLFTCDRVGCAVAMERAESYSPAFGAASQHDTVELTVEMPAGWRVDRANRGLDLVVHCPEHTA